MLGEHPIQGDSHDSSLHKSRQFGTAANKIGMCARRAFSVNAMNCNDTLYQALVNKSGRWVNAGKTWVI